MGRVSGAKRNTEASFATLVLKTNQLQPTRASDHQLFALRVTTQFGLDVFPCPPRESGPLWGSTTGGAHVFNNLVQQ